MRKHEEVAAAIDRQGLDPDHEMAQDATGMYPLKQAIALKHYVLTLLLPAAVIHILGFGSVYGLLRSNGLGDVTLLVAASLPGLLLSSLFLLMARRDDLRRLGRSFYPLRTRTPLRHRAGDFLDSLCRLSFLCQLSLELAQLVARDDSSGRWFDSGEYRSGLAQLRTVELHYVRRFDLAGQRRQLQHL